MKEVVVGLWSFLIISIVVIYRKDSIIFLIQTQNCHTRLTYKEKNLWSEQILIFFKKSSFHFDVFSIRITFSFKCGKAIFQQSRSLKSQSFPLGVNHGLNTDFSKFSKFMSSQKHFPNFDPCYAFNFT